MEKAEDRQVVGVTKVKSHGDEEATEEETLEEILPREEWKLPARVRGEAKGEAGGAIFTTCP